MPRLEKSIVPPFWNPSVALELQGLNRGEIQGEHCLMKKRANPPWRRRRWTIVKQIILIENKFNWFHWTCCWAWSEQLSWSCQNPGKSLSPDADKSHHGPINWFSQDLSTPIESRRPWLYIYVMRTLNSVWKGAICSRRISKCLISNNCPSLACFPFPLDIEDAALATLSRQADRT